LVGSFRQVELDLLASALSSRCPLPEGLQAVADTLIAPWSCYQRDFGSAAID